MLAYCTLSEIRDLDLDHVNFSTVNFAEREREKHNLCIYPYEIQSQFFQ